MTNIRRSIFGGGIATTAAAGTGSAHEASTGSSIVANADDRIAIALKNKRFVPGHPVAKKIGEIFLENLEDGGYQWSKISPATKTYYWEEFKKIFRWPTASDAVVYEVWQRVASRHYSIKLCRLRNNKDGKPGSVPQAVWDKWQEHWSTPDWRAKSKAARKNRLSETGGEGSGCSRHTGGSLSIIEHTLRMKKELQQQVTSWEVLKKTHKKRIVHSLIRDHKKSVMRLKIWLLPCRNSKWRIHKRF